MLVDIEFAADGTPGMAETEYRCLFDRSPEPTWALDPESLRILEVNRAALDKYGYSRGEFLSLTAGRLRASGEVADFLTFLRTIGSSEATVPRIIQHHASKAGEVFEVELLVSRIRLREREAFVCLARDLGARRRAELAARALFDEAPVPYHEIDRNGIVVRVNQAECEMLGIPASEIVGRPVWDLVSPADRERARASVERKLRQGKLPPAYERQYEGRDARVRILEFRERLILGPAGEVTGIRTALLDVTKAKEAQRQISFQATLLDQVTDGVIAVDADFRVTYCNRAAQRMFDWPDQTALGKGYGELVEHGYDLSRRLELRRALMENGTASNDFVSHRRSPAMVVQGNFTLLRDDQGQIVGALGIHRDVTELRQAEEARAASDQRFAMAQAALALGAWTITPEAGHLLVSEQMLRLLGIPGNLSSLPRQTWLACIHPDDRLRMEQDVSTWNSIESLDREYRVVWPDGSLHWVFDKATAIRDAGGQIQRIVGVAFDITAQKQSEDRLRLLSASVEQCQVSILITDLNGNIQYANARAVETTGYALEEILGRNPRMFSSGETAGEQYRTMWETIPQGVWRGTFHNKRKNGDLFWEAATIGPIRDDSGAVTHFLAVKEDITELRETQEALRLSEERFRVAAENLGDIIYEWDTASDQVVVFGHGAARIRANRHGFPLTGDEFGSFIHPDDRADVRKAIDRLLRERKTQQVEYRAVLPTGQIRDWSDCLSVVRNAAGQPCRVIGVNRDITEERAAARATAELAAIVESADAAIISKDLDGKILTWNASAVRMFGYTATEVIGRNIDALVPEDGLTEEASVRAQVRAGTPVQHLETTRLTKSGARINVLISISPLRDKAGQLIGASQVVWDVTELRMLQRQLAQAQKLESIGQLAAGIAHEINTPIQYVGDNAKFLEQAFQDMAPYIDAHEHIVHALHQSPEIEFADTLARGLRDMDIDYLRAEVPKAAGQLLEGVAQVARIVRAMKEFSHQGPVDKSPHDLSRAIENTVLVSRNEWKYVAELTTDFDPELPPVPCVAGELNQVILNLIVNAAHAIEDVVKATGQKGSIHISTRRNGDWAEIRVRDSGSGIPEEIRARVFDPFFTTKQVGKGSGQGLSISHAVIVKKHAGRLSFETRQEAGTTFLIELPLGQLESM